MSSEYQLLFEWPGRRQFRLPWHDKSNMTPTLGLTTLLFYQR